MAKTAEIPQGNVETLHAPHGTSSAPKTEKAKRGEGHTITIDLKDYPQLLAKIKEAAKADDREPSKLLRRRLVQLDESGDLFGDFPDEDQTDSEI